MRVLTRERHVSPLIAIDLWIHAGAREENKDEEGSAHFLEHVLFKGTATRGIGQADVDIENLGGTLNAATGPDYAHFYTTVATAHASQALHILADVIRHAAFPDAEVERERGVILDELAQHDSKPEARIIDALYANAYPLHPYSHSPGGSPDAIRLRGRDTLAAFYARVYQPGRCSLVLVGDLTPDQARQWAEQAFGDWKSASSIPLSTQNAAGSDPHAGQRAVSFLPIPIFSAQPINVIGTVSRACVGIAFPAPPAGDYRNAAAALLAAEILGESQRAGRFTARRSENDAAAHYTPRQDSSLWILTASTQNRSPGVNEANQPGIGQQTKGVSGSRDGGAAALRMILNSLRTSPPNTAELLDARRRLLGRLESEQETNAGLAEAVGYADLTHAEPPESLRQRMLQMTAEDVHQFCARYILSQPGLIVRFMPSVSYPTGPISESSP